MGKLRAENGHPEPYNVKYWGIGNEVYGDYQIGHTDAAFYATGLVDIAKELERIEKELEKARKNLSGIEAKLSNEKFTARAPENVVNAEREKAQKAKDLIAQLEQSEAAMKKL